MAHFEETAVRSHHTRISALALMCLIYVIQTGIVETVPVQIAFLQPSAQPSVLHSADNSQDTDVVPGDAAKYFGRDGPSEAGHEKGLSRHYVWNQPLRVRHGRRLGQLYRAYAEVVKDGDKVNPFEAQEMTDFSGKTSRDNKKSHKDGSYKTGGMSFSDVESKPSALLDDSERFEESVTFSSITKDAGFSASNTEDEHQTDYSRAPGQVHDFTEMPYKMKELGKRATPGASLNLNGVTDGEETMDLDSRYKGFTSARQDISITQPYLHETDFADHWRTAISTVRPLFNLQTGYQESQAVDKDKGIVDDTLKGEEGRYRYSMKDSKSEFISEDQKADYFPKENLDMQELYHEPLWMRQPNDEFWIPVQHTNLFGDRGMEEIVNNSRGFPSNFLSLFDDFRDAPHGNIDRHLRFFTVMARLRAQPLQNMLKLLMETNDDQSPSGNTMYEPRAAWDISDVDARFLPVGIPKPTSTQIYLPETLLTWLNIPIFSKTESSSKSTRAPTPLEVMKRGSRSCNYRRINLKMLVEFFLTGKMCGSHVVRMRFGIGKR